jgi:hypothetical protein
LLKFVIFLKLAAKIQYIRSEVENLECIQRAKAIHMHSELSPICEETLTLPEDSRLQRFTSSSDHHPMTLYRAHREDHSPATQKKGQVLQLRYLAKMRDKKHHR